MGTWRPPSHPGVAIRYLHIEPRRVVIDVAGPSSATDEIFARLREITGDILAADGLPTIGDPEQILDYSEYTTAFSGDVGHLLTPRIREVFASAWRRPNGPESAMLVPTVFMQPTGEEYPGFAGDSRSFHFSVRAGTRLDDRVYFSAAPLDSERHRVYLADLAAGLAE